MEGSFRLYALSPAQASPRKDVRRRLKRTAQKLPWPPRSTSMGLRGVLPALRAPAAEELPTRPGPGAGRGLGHRGAARPTRACTNPFPSLSGNGDGRSALAHVVGVFSQHLASGHLQRTQPGHLGFRSESDAAGWLCRTGQPRAARQCAARRQEGIGRIDLWAPRPDIGGMGGSDTKARGPDIKAGAAKGRPGRALYRCRSPCRP
jgi:hypothetical protein